MKSVLIRMRESRNAVSSAEKGILEHLLKKPEDAINLSIQELAGKTFSSPSTIIRMCRRIGFSGYKDFRRAITCEIAIRKQSHKVEQQEISKTDSMQEIIDKITYKNIVSLEDTRNLLDTDTLQKCVNLICKSNIVCLFGIGSSLCVARDAYLKFLRLNKLCILNDDWHSQLLQARNMTSKDVGIVISYSGQTMEMLECMKAMHNNGAPIIAITRYRRSPVSELSTYNIYVAANESTFRSGAISSRISQLNVIDILYTAFANSEYDYCLERLAKTHIEKSELQT